MTLREELLAYITSEDYKPQTKEDLAKFFNLEVQDYRPFFRALIDMEKEGHIMLSKKGKYLAVDNKNNLVGKLIGNPGGFAFFEPEDKSLSDVFIPQTELKGAMHGDRVMVRIMKEGSQGLRSEGEVVRIISDPPEEIVGTFVRDGKFGFVEPNNGKFSQDIYISKDDINGAKNGDKVVVRVISRAKANRKPEGEITEILGSKNEEGIEITSIARQFGLPYIFPKEVSQEAMSLGKEVLDKDLVNRTDFTKLFTVTIDGEDAKDFDDAISIAREGENFRLYVHIADVAHYVKPDSEIDREAYKRGNSVYLLDRVIPMLPEEISNELCSLKPGEVRLTHTTEMLIDQKGKVIDYKFYESYIKSDYRLIYNDVSDFLEGKREISDPILAENLTAMKDLFEILKEKRYQKGAIDFNIPETSFDLDEAGKVIDIGSVERRVSNMIIEEFMVINNEVVGEHFGFMEYPFVYRIHEEPSEERIKTFEILMHNLGYRFKGKDLHPRDFQEILEEVKGKKEEPLVAKLLLRSMAKAKYSTEPIGHFGLASKYYSHFTAPIRRYSDLIIHRIFSNQVNNRLEMNYTDSDTARLEEAAVHVSNTERNAEEAERAVEDLLKVQYMRQFIGEEFDGIVSSLTNFGIFVQLDNTVEGLVHFRNMNDDYYHFDEKNFVVRGERSNRIVSLGDKVRIKVTGINEDRYEIDFIIVKW